MADNLSKPSAAFDRASDRQLFEILKHVQGVEMPKRRIVRPMSDANQLTAPVIAKFLED